MTSAKQDPPSAYDPAKIDTAVLALLHLNRHIERYKVGHNRDKTVSIVRAWKSLNGDALDRLHQAGPISNPRSRAASVVLSPRRRPARCGRVSDHVWPNRHVANAGWVVPTVTEGSDFCRSVGKAEPANFLVGMTDQQEIEP